MANTGDSWVLNVQKWVNEKFRGKSGYTEIEENGLTGWNTIFALLHGLQITLEVGSTANNFGTGTINAFNSFIDKNGPIKERTKEDDEELLANSLIVSNDTAKYQKLIDQYDKIHGIIQGALLCKGYNIGATKPTGHFYGGTASAIKKLKSDAGISDTSSEVTLNIMKSLMSMDYFYSYDNSEKTQNIIEMQRYLNRNYEEYIGLRPCDGIYSRSTNTALIYAIQYEENMPKTVANGNCGPATSGALPYLLVNESELQKSNGKDYNGKAYSSNSLSKFKTLATIALYLNGFGSGILSNGLNENVIKIFQSNYGLDQTGKIDKSTWLSMLISCGDTSRSSVACDTRFEMTDERIKYLKDNNYQIVGRYLTGGDFKELRFGEPKKILDSGLKFFPIFQESATDLSYFTYERGMKDANSATAASKIHKIPKESIIYFAVDTDPQNSDIVSRILPYFEGIKHEMSTNLGEYYKIGIYATRNACNQVIEKGYATTCFVSDMSTGFSGNMGFNIPENWNLDQFYEIKNIPSADGQWDLDKVSYSGKYPVVTTLSNIDSTDEYFNLLIYKLSKLEKYANDYLIDKGEYPIIKEKNKLILQYLRNESYNSILWDISAGSIDYNFVNYVKGRNDTSILPKNILIPKKNYPMMGIEHLAATLNSLIYKSVLDDEVNDLAGWAGDLLQLGCVYCGATKGESNVNTDDLELMIGSLDDSLANKYLSDGKEHHAAELGFGYEDYEHDIDSLSIGIDLLNGKTISEAFKDYYMGNSYSGRFATFVSSVLGNKVEKSLREDLLKKAKKYTKLQTATSIEFVNHFADKYGDYDSEKIGDILAEIFVDKFFKDFNN